MRKAINCQGLLRFTTQRGESGFDGVDLSNVVLRTGGMDSMFKHPGRGYGFREGESVSYGKPDYKDYGTINPWYADFISFCHRHHVEDIIYVANTLGEDYASNKSAINTIHHAPTVNLFGVELGNEPWDKYFDFNVWNYFRTIEPYLTNSLYGANVCLPIEKKINRKFADSFVEMVDDEAFNSDTLAIHAYFNPSKLTQELDDLIIQVQAIRERTNAKIWITETNIHNSHLHNMSNDALWDCWVQMYTTFEELGIDLVCHHNLIAFGVSSLIDQDGPKTKSDGTRLIDFFTQ